MNTIKKLLAIFLGMLIAVGGASALGPIMAAASIGVSGVNNPTYFYLNGTVITPLSGYTLAGGGGGSSGGTWATTTSQVAGRLINHPNNNTDVVVIGASATTSANYYIDPNINFAYLLNASSSQHSIFSKLYVGGSATTTIDSAGNIVIPSGSSLTNTGVSNGCGTWASGVLGSTGSACDSGGGSDPFTHPASGQSATTSLMLLNGNASTTIFSDFGPGYFGGTSTSTIQGNGNTSTLNSALTISTTSATALQVQDQYGTNVVKVQTASSTSNGAIFQIQATSTTDTLFQVDQYGHLTASSTRATPTVSCSPSGGTIAATSNDVTGDITSGTNSTSCTVTFASAYSATPEVFITDSNTSAVADISSRSTTAFTVSLASALSAVNISYFVVMP